MDESFGHIDLIDRKIWKRISNTNLSMILLGIAFNQKLTFKFNEGRWFLRIDLFFKYFIMYSNFNEYENESRLYYRLFLPFGSDL